MKIVYTKYADEQIEFRKVQKVWVEETIKSPDVIKNENPKFYAIKKLNGKKLKVVYVKKSFIKVITVFYVK